MDNDVTTVTFRRHISASALERFYRERENIADAALGLDDSWRARIDLELASQPQHLDIDAAIENVLVHPRRLQQILPRQRPLGCFEKGDQQRVLALAQRNRGSIRIEELPAAPLQHPPVEPVATPLGIACARRPPDLLPP